jgi:thiamine biosynthesis protein ThiS
MKIAVKLAGALEDHLPPGSSNPTDIEIGADATLLDVLRRLRFPAGERYLIAVNGEVVPQSEHGSRALAQDDSVAIMSPLKGG